MTEGNKSNVIAFQPRKAPPENSEVSDFLWASIHELIAHLAVKLGVSKENIQAMLKAVFRIDHIIKLEGRDLERALAFLMDLDGCSAVHPAAKTPANSSSR